MSKITNVILAGYSGHGYVVADAALESGMPLFSYTDINEAFSNPFKLNYLGDESDPDNLVWKLECSFILGIGNNKTRALIAEKILANGKHLLSVQHPHTSISKSSVIGDGTFISRNVSVNPMAKIGKYCILNTASVIEHGCVLSDGVHIAPGAVLAGDVFVGEHSFIGANSVIKQGIRIGKNVIVGAGAVIVKNIEDNSVIYSNPGK